jgi:hypothetical protein
MNPGTTRQLTATVLCSGNQAVVWTVLTSGSAAATRGKISDKGIYSAAFNLTALTKVEIAATSKADPSKSTSTMITVLPATILVTPLQAKLAASATLKLQTVLSGLSSSAVQWTVNGVPGGDSLSGTISADGIYVAPGVSPGSSVLVAAVSSLDSSLSGSAVLTIVNTAPVKISGATYAGTVQSWTNLALPWIDSLVGLNWDPVSRVWIADPSWQLPSAGVGPSVYFLEEALRPATRLAIARQDIPLMEELALFHLALLKNRTTTIHAMESSAQPGDYIFIDGHPADRTFAWYEPLPQQKREIRESQLSDVQYLSTAARLVRAIAQMPVAQRTTTLTRFAATCGTFLVNEQLTRLLYGSTWWAHWQNPQIGNPVVTAWKFLAANPGYLPAPPAPQYEAGISDIELWLMMDTAEMVAADAAAPEFGLMNEPTRVLLKDAVQSGSRLMQTRCHHETASDGADVLSAFAGEWQDLPDFTYSAVTTAQIPSVPDVQPELSWDSSHAYRLPIVFRSMYETAGASGASYPGLSDVVALGNTYAHLTLSKASSFPAFNNYLDGTDGWFQFDPAQPLGGYPPHRYCDSRAKGNCTSIGTVQGWGQLGSLNPDIAVLEQRMINLAYDDSSAATAFKDQYYYADGHYSMQSGSYPWLMMWIAADSAEQLP